MTPSTADLDVLTGIPHREAFVRSFDAFESGTLVSLAMIDLDGFKELNDEFGHAVGDVLLRAHAQTIKGSLPDDALVGRFGGDEFVVALPGASPESALIVLEEVRAYLAVHVPVPEIGHAVPITIGIAARPGSWHGLDELLTAADAAMYRAKSDGRNRVAIHVDEKMVMKSNYYDRAALARLNKLAENLGRTEASLLREALADLFDKRQGDL